MRLRHFEQLRPLCPVCRGNGRAVPRLELATVVVKESDGQIVQGVLRCTRDDCLSEFPIIDGIPIIVPNVREYVSANIGSITARDDISDTLEGILGDCAGAGSAFDVTRQQAGSYCWDHYADLDLSEEAGTLKPGSIVRLLERAAALAGPIPRGPILDAGCAMGRTTFHLAALREAPVLGIDLNFSFLRTAATVLRRGVVTYPRRRVGLVYDRRTFKVSFPHADHVDFWACDTMALPFEDRTFAAVTAVNLLDSVHSPLLALLELTRVLLTGGKAVLAAPWDWSPAVTPLGGWIGGHSQRGPDRGASEPVLNALLTPGKHPASLKNMRVIAEEARVPWSVRLHDRSVVEYQVHVVVGEKENGE